MKGDKKPDYSKQDKTNANKTLFLMKEREQKLQEDCEFEKIVEQIPCGVRIKYRRRKRWK